MHSFQHARVGCVVASLAVITALASCKKAEPTASAPAAATPAVSAATPASTTPTPAASSAPAAAGEAPEAVRRIMGRWLRSDGTYALELKNPEKSGVVQASYFNPKSIHVSRAIWMQGGPGLQIAVELNDVGYPGATYVLTYDAQADRLVGQYTQPAMQQSFDVEFVRHKMVP